MKIKKSRIFGMQEGDTAILLSSLKMMGGVQFLHLKEWNRSQISVRNYNELNFVSLSQVKRMLLEIEIPGSYVPVFDKSLLQAMFGC